MIRDLRARHHARRDDQGAILVLVLIFVTVFSLVLAALLSSLGVNLNQSLVSQDQSQLQYAADAGIEWGVNQLAQPNAHCNSGTSIAGTPFFPVSNSTGTAPLTNPATGNPLTNSATGNGAVNVTVDCMPVTGVGSGTFGGFSVVTGMNYPGVPGYPTTNTSYQSEEYAGTQTCTGFSADPIGSGKSTYAKQVGATSNNPPVCLSYPTSSGAPVWNDSSFLPQDPNDVAVTPGTIDQVFAVDATDLFGVGAAPTAPNADKTKEGLYYFDPVNNDTFEYVGGATSTGTTLNGVWAPTKDPNDVWVVGNGGLIQYCNSNCTGGSPTWTTQASGTSSDLNAITGTGAAGSATLWAAGDGTLLTGDGSTWTSVFPSPVSGTATITNGTKNITSVALFTGTANYVGWTVTGTGIPNTTIASENNTTHVAVMMNNANQNQTESVTLTPPLQPTFNAVHVDANGNVWAVGTLNNVGVIYECAASCTAPASWTSVTGVPNVNYLSITGTGTALWAVGGGSIATCPSACNVGANWVKVNVAGATFNSVVAADPADVWAVGNAGVIDSCTSSCTTVGAIWSAQAVNATESTFNSITAVPAALRADPSTWQGSVWTAGTIPSPPGAGVGTGWAVYSPLSASGPALLDLKGGSVLNGGYLNAVTPITLDGGNFVQYASGACPSQPSSNSLKINGGSWLCTNSFSALSSLDEPLPSESSGTGLAHCVAANTCADMSAANVTVNVPTSSPYYSTGCTSFTEFFPGYYKGAPKLDTSGGASLGTNYFASGVYYFSGGGWGAIDSIQKTGNADGTTTSGSTTVTSASAFNQAKVGYTVTDSAAALGPDATITNLTSSGGPGSPITATLSVAATLNESTDTFTVANPASVIGGQPGPGDTTTIAKDSPCWNYISHNGQALDSPSGFASLGNICGAGATACAFPAGNWYEGGGAAATPNGTGVDWILGGGTWLDVHTVNMELFTRTVPLSTLTGATPSSIAAQVTNEGTEFVSMREIPPACPAGSTQTAGFTDGAMHPGPFCVLTSSNWAPLNPGANNQVLQIDANNHDPYVYIHGAIYMPDNDLTLFTDQPQRDVWVGALDVNSLELTYDSAQAPPIQIISGGNPNPVAMEFIVRAQDASSGTSLWEEAVVNEQTRKVQSWRVCNGPATSTPPLVSACST